MEYESENAKFKFCESEKKRRKIKLPVNIIWVAFDFLTHFINVNNVHLH